MGLLSDIFDIDKETEQDIRDIIKIIGIIALIAGGAGAAGNVLELPFNNEKED
ncbi:hypothetical protein SAMN02910353_03040 [Ruminococcus sp. YRD2003]|uniref:hypothetical protein n=1 Tax=Ruminococcus sp. YRD2003 TaxID=1452313 RepID=UPI0008B8909A|nr:hypothetical protein SAMN02910353_03040 [Ruminococcus flavefaciens]